MRITEKDAQRRVSSENNLANLAVTHAVTPRRGSGKRGPALPEFLRDTLSDLANQPDVKQTDISEAFGVSDAEVSFCKTGRIGGLPPTEERAVKRDDRLSKIKDTAILKLMSSLNLINDTDLAGCKPKELSAIAVNLSRVVKDHTEQQSTLNGPQVNVVIYSPETRPESKYKVIDA